MSDKPELLVVADEQDPLCECCSALLQAFGVRVLTASKASDAIELAQRRRLLGIVLRISDFGQDRDRCLRLLGRKRPETPTILLADSSGHGIAVSLASPGVADCLLEPVSPEDLVQALWRLLHHEGLVATAASSPEAIPACASVSECQTGGEGCRFWGESWLRFTEHGLALTGVLPPLAERASFRSLSLPRVGDMVYQGLPLAYALTEDGPPQLVASPLSGVIVGVNSALEQNTKALVEDPCRRGWIALICPTRLNAELNNCRPRNVILVNSDRATAIQQSQQLCGFGCDVRVVSGWPDAVQALRDRNNTIIVLDSTSLGTEGPSIAGRLRMMAPEMRLVVVASAGARFEIEYRRLNVYFYAIEPFADGEIADILGAAFRPLGESSEIEAHDAIPEQCYGVRMINRDGHKVRLLALGGLLQQRDGLGAWIHRKLQERLISHEMIGGQAKAGLAVLGAEAARCDRLLVLAARDTGRLPGSLVRDTRGEFATVPPDAAGRMTGLMVQPDPWAGEKKCVGRRTAAHLAEHVVNEMTLSWRVPRCVAAGPPGSCPVNRSRTAE